MDDAILAFATGVGRSALARDWAAVHAALAPWLQARLTVDDVRAFFEDEYRATLESVGVQDLRHPEYEDPDVGGNGHTRASNLREPISWEGGRRRDVPPEVTDDNMRYWARIQLQCSDAQMEELEIDFLAEVWAAIVDTPQGLRIGYWSQGAY